jgi:hypothetical protein
MKCRDHSGRSEAKTGERLEMIHVRHPKPPEAVGGSFIQVRLPWVVRPEIQNSVVRLLWAGYRRTLEGWLNLAVILELLAQRVIG